jgi:hypothetical protein
MPETHEKRQRDRRKQQKRKDKIERRQQRKNAKLFAESGGASPMYHTLRRGNDQYQVDTDLWLSVLNLTAVAGWAPPASEDPEYSYPRAYSRPHGLELTDAHAVTLAKSIEAVLPTISKEELQYTTQRFGEEHTEELLTRRAAGERLAVEDAASAHELLGGPPKAEVERLAAFLKEGGASMEAN